MPVFFASSAQASGRAKPPDKATTRKTRGCATSASKRPASAGIDNFNMTLLSPERLSSAFNISSRNIASHCARSALLMLTSGSIIGIRLCDRICSATSNCCFTMAAMPVGDAKLTTERILVPKTPLAFARSSNAPSLGIGFIICTPSASSSSPLSTFRNGTTPRSHKATGTGLPPASPSIVRSKRIAPITFSPLKQGEVMMRLRISWIRPNISSSFA